MEYFYLWSVIYVSSNKLGQKSYRVLAPAFTPTGCSRWCSVHMPLFCLPSAVQLHITMHAYICVCVLVFVWVCVFECVCPVLPWAKLGCSAEKPGATSVLMQFCSHFLRRLNIHTQRHTKHALQWKEKLPICLSLQDKSGSVTLTLPEANTWKGQCSRPAEAWMTYNMAGVIFCSTLINSTAHKKV